MKLERIFLDLDGTLLDVEPRYQKLHEDVVRRHGGEPLDPADYWQAKREGVPEPELLARAGLAPENVAAAVEDRLLRIEERRYLTLDRPWPWTKDVLRALERTAPLVLVTVRKNADRVLWQLDRFRLRRLFRRVVIGPGDGTPEAKVGLLLQAGFFGIHLRGAVLVGDTEIDIASGRRLGVETIAVASGLRSPDRLAAWQPDALLDDLRQLSGYLDGRRSPPQESQV